MVFLGRGRRSGFTRCCVFVLPLLPAAARQWDTAIVALGLVGMLYGALLWPSSALTCARLLAFAVISHTGALVAGLFLADRLRVQGGVFCSARIWGWRRRGCSSSRVCCTAVWVRPGSTKSAVVRRRALAGLTFWWWCWAASPAMPGTPGFEAAIWRWKECSNPWLGWPSSPLPAMCWRPAICYGPISGFSWPAIRRA